MKLALFDSPLFCDMGVVATATLVLIRPLGDRQFNGAGQINNFIIIRLGRKYCEKDTTWSVVAACVGLLWRGEVVN